jgi:Raf kinase inhibitor-like YbhB/YbcL family protein
MSLILKSPAFSQGKPIPTRHSGDGEDLSPALEWSGVPAAAKELALIVDDPDAPTKDPWVHWIIYKISAETNSLAEGIPALSRPDAPAGVLQGKNSWNTLGFRGPAPPKGHGVHRYFFKLFALDAALGLPPGMDKADLLKAMAGHIVGEAELMGTYYR